MTQSGQGEEPSARPAREGIVLPSDGGEPLLPGTAGDRTTPAGGQAWGRPWGPDQSAVPAAQPGDGWGAPENGTQTWGAAEPPQSATPAPDWGTPDASQGWRTSADPHGAQQPQGFAPQSASDAGPLPPEGAGPPSYGAQSGFAPGAQGAYAAGGYVDGYAAPGQQAPHVQQPGQAAYPGNALPQAAYPGNGLPQAPHVQQPPQAGHPGNALPQAAPYGSAAGSSPSLPPAAQPAPLPPGADDGATQYIPYIPPAPGADGGATQYLPPVAAAPDEGATQYIPPVGPGALPPEVPADATQFLGRTPQGGPGAGPLPSAASPDAEATQFIAPVPAQPAGAPYGIRPGAPEDRQPPAEFDSLFRSEPEGPASTQQMPRFDPSAPHARHGAQAAYGAQPSQGAPGAYGAQAPYGAHAPGAPGGRAAARRGGASDGEGGGGRGGRSGSRVPVIAAVGIGIAVLGIGAGALLSGGGDGKKDSSKTVSATAPATEGSASPSTDPVKAQAVELDKLLADSSNSRDSVINAVANVKTCDNLGQAASDLRDAAKQRGELVTRLAALSVDRLPNHAGLTTALTNGWKASASADNHYAAWADQVAGKKGCRKGHARTTAQTQAGNRASGTASTEKEKAAKLWNSIASTYGLTQRTRTQL
ncbi:hypothetical protein AB0D27_15785 [Streptomyces sp. NPDC048415]|uniref:hypothetical protein n=1 Tax=Streptomyces sp. NPDC048415 TaxID=3154822 RepID=UPI00341D669A